MIKEVKLEEKPKKELTEAEKIAEAVTKERERILVLLLSNRAQQASDYKNTIRHTGGLLTQSMTFAFSKGLEAAFKLIVNKKENNEKAV